MTDDVVLLGYRIDWVGYGRMVATLDFVERVEREIGLVLGRKGSVLRDVC